MSLDPHAAASADLSAPDLRRIDEALAKHALSRLGEPQFLTNSTINENFRVETSAGPHLVRVYPRDRTAERLDVEVAATLFALNRGIPVRLPLTTPGGRSYHSISGRSVAVYPWLEAGLLQRGSITPDQAAAMGDMHGRIHLAFRDYGGPEPRSGGNGSSWDTEQSIAELSRVDDLIRYYPAPGEALLRIQDQLRFKLDLLESGAARPRSHFEALAVQPTHGDYHDGNILLAGDGSILAVIDWESVGYLPPVFELLRALTLSRLLEPPLLAAYLGSYAAHRGLTLEECHLGVEMWWQSLLHDTWLYTQRYVRGVRTLDRFFPDDAAHTRRFADAAFRDWLTAQLLTHARV